jgi:hypothetical protein
MVEAKSERKAKNSPIEKLMRTIPFTEMDLETNQRFKLSKVQQEHLKPKVDLYFYLTIFAVFIFSIATLSFAYAGRGSTALFSLTVLSGIVTTIGVIGVILSFRIKLNLISREGIRTVAGKADLNIFFSGDNHDIPNYQMTINGVTFQLTEELFDSFTEEKFRVYYFRIWRKEILSAEKLD